MYLILMVYACLISCSLINKSKCHSLVYFNIRWTCVVILHKNTYAYSFYLRVIRAWNLLPAEIMRRLYSSHSACCEHSLSTSTSPLHSTVKRPSDFSRMVFTIYCFKNNFFFHVYAPTAYAPQPSSFVSP